MEYDESIDLYAMLMEKDDVEYGDMLRLNMTHMNLSVNWRSYITHIGQRFEWVEDVCDKLGMPLSVGFYLHT